MKSMEYQRIITERDFYRAIVQGLFNNNGGTLGLGNIVIMIDYRLGENMDQDKILRERVLQKIRQLKSIFDAGRGICLSGDLRTVYKVLQHLKMSADNMKMFNIWTSFESLLRTFQLQDELDEFNEATKALPTLDELDIQLVRLDAWEAFIYSDDGESSRQERFKVLSPLTSVVEERIERHFPLLNYYMNPARGKKPENTNAIWINISQAGTGDFIRRQEALRDAGRQYTPVIFMDQNGNLQPFYFKPAKVAAPKHTEETPAHV